MTLRDTIDSTRNAFIDWVAKFIQWNAESFGFPEKPGMPLYTLEKFKWMKFFQGSDLPARTLRFPPPTTADNIGEVFFGNWPQVSTVTKHYYLNKTDGYFSYYLEDFRTTLFLPNFISEFIQIQFNLCRDLSFVEFSRDTIFGILVIYHHLLTLRLLLNWFISINPYAFPTAYFTALVDWFEEAAAQYIPALNGIPLATPLFMAGIGKIGDVLNHLVLTMPFLPSEGEKIKTEIDGIPKAIRVFRYLPVLWYRYPIPNDLREFWFKERPDVLEYLIKAYAKLKIQFLPDQVVLELKQLSQSIIHIPIIIVPFDLDSSHFLQM